MKSNFDEEILNTIYKVEPFINNDIQYYPTEEYKTKMLKIRDKLVYMDCLYLMMKTIKINFWL